MDDIFLFIKVSHIFILAVFRFFFGVFVWFVVIIYYYVT